jgi:hypothetical protein
MSVDACARQATSQRQGETVDHASFMKIIDINVIPRIFVSQMLIDWEGTAALSFAIPGLLDVVQVRHVEGGGIEDLVIILRGFRAVHGCLPCGATRDLHDPNPQRQAKKVNNTYRQYSSKNKNIQQQQVFTDSYLLDY